MSDVTPHVNMTNLWQLRIDWYWKKLDCWKCDVEFPAR